MPTVYVVNDRGQDLSAAARFGQVRFLLEGVPNVFATDRLVRQLHLQLLSSTPEDHLIPVGSMPVLALAAAYLASKHGHLNLLLFDFHTQSYVARRVKLDEARSSEATTTKGEKR